MNLVELTAYCRAEGRVCPMPIPWDRLWKLLPGRERVKGGWSPALPLILAAWNTTTDDQKRDRLAFHLRYAQDNGALPAVADLLLSLPPDQWRTERGDWGA